MREKDWWKEPIETFGMRTLFHALCAYDGDDTWGDMLAYVIERPWVAELKDRLRIERCAGCSDRTWLGRDQELGGESVCDKHYWIAGKSGDRHARGEGSRHRSEYPRRRGTTVTIGRG